MNYPTNSLKLNTNQSIHWIFHHTNYWKQIQENSTKKMLTHHDQNLQTCPNISFFFIFDNPGYPDQLAQCPNISLNHTSCLSCYIIYTKKAIIPCIFWLGVWSHTWLWHILQKHILNKPWIIYCSSNLAIVRNPNINLQCIRSLINSLLV